METLNKIRNSIIVKCILLAILFNSCQKQQENTGTLTEKTPKSVAPQIVRDAQNQIGKTLRYDPAYEALSYPMGDVPLERGVCTDVVIRALRHQKMDLQELVHQDMKKNFAVYPKKWGLSRPDPNIDHRRVPNLITFFTRQGWSVRGQDFRAGDIVTWELSGSHRPHIGIVSDKKNGKTPLIIHNIGRGTREDDLLFRHKITGHFRLPVK